MRDVDLYYYGSYPTVLDDAGRMNVPRRIKETMERLDHYTWYMTPGLNGNLYLYNREEWAKVLARHASSYERLDQRTHQYFTFLYGFTAETRVDRQGRMPIPSQLREGLGLEREVVLVGVQDRLELWNKRGWEAFCREMWPDFGRRATDLASGVLMNEKGGTSDGNSAE